MESKSVTLTREEFDLHMMLLHQASEEMERLESENDVLRLALAASSDAGDELAAEADRFGVSVQILTTNNSALHDRALTLANELRAARISLTKTQKKLESVIDENSRLTWQNSSFRSTIDLLTARITGLEQDVRQRSSITLSSFEDIDPTDLLKLCHPDRHGGKLSEIATRVTAKILDARRSHS